MIIRGGYHSRWELMDLLQAMLGSSVSLGKQKRRSFQSRKRTMRSNLVERQENLGTWSWGRRVIPCITMQNTQEAQKDITMHGAAFSTDCSAGGQADITNIITSTLTASAYITNALILSPHRSPRAFPPPPSPLLHPHLHIYNRSMRQCRIENELQQVRQLPWAQVIECSPKGIERDDLWVVWVPGRPQTPWEGGNYPVEVSFPPQYPKTGPTITFQPSFRHAHVYEGGSICLPLIESQYWRAKTNMSDILQRIISLIHQDFNPYSPANVDVFKLSRDQPVQYQQTVREQARRYAKKDEKYFIQPCVHININVQ